MPKVLDLFCGCGGLTLGLSQAEHAGVGFECALGIDHWGAALSVFSHNGLGPYLNGGITPELSLEAASKVRSRPFPIGDPSLGSKDKIWSARRIVTAILIAQRCRLLAKNHCGEGRT